MDEQGANSVGAGRVACVLGLPGAPSVVVLHPPAGVAWAVRVLGAIAQAAPRGVSKQVLGEDGAAARTALEAVRQSHLIVSKKGPGGGYRLARPAEDISLLDVAEAVGWSVRLELPRVPVRGGDELHRRLQGACDDAAEAGWAALRAVSLADLLDGESAEQC
jgi:DNA-binding IscR family transcriptional regulator